MKVILRITSGITTKTINLPESIVNTEFKVPLRPQMSLVDFQNTLMQSMITPETTKQKCLIFRWDGISKWGSGSPIMDLVDYY